MNIKDLIEGYKLINGGQSASVVLLDMDPAIDINDEVLDSKQLVENYKRLNLLNSPAGVILLSDILKALNAGASNTSVSQDMTYDKAVELGLNTEYNTREQWEQFANDNSNALNKMFIDMNLWGQGFYTKEDFLYNTLLSNEAMIREAGQYNSTVGQGVLPSKAYNIPQEFIDYQNDIYAENGEFRGNFIEFLYEKIAALESRVTALENK